MGEQAPQESRQGPELDRLLESLPGWTWAPHERRFEERLAHYREHIGAWTAIGTVPSGAAVAVGLASGWSLVVVVLAILGVYLMVGPPLELWPWHQAEDLRQVGIRAGHSIKAGGDIEPTWPSRQDTASRLAEASARLRRLTPCCSLLPQHIGLAGDL